MLLMITLNGPDSGMVPNGLKAISWTNKDHDLGHHMISEQPTQLFFFYTPDPVYHAADNAARYWPVMSRGKGKKIITENPVKHPCPSKKINPQRSIITSEIGSLTHAAGTRMTNNMEQTLVEDNNHRLSFLSPARKSHSLSHISLICQLYLTLSNKVKNTKLLVPTPRLGYRRSGGPSWERCTRGCQHRLSSWQPLVHLKMAVVGSLFRWSYKKCLRLILFRQMNQFYIPKYITSYGRICWNS